MTAGGPAPHQARARRLRPRARIAIERQQAAAGISPAVTTVRKRRGYRPAHAPGTAGDERRIERHLALAGRPLTLRELADLTGWSRAGTGMVLRALLTAGRVELQATEQRRRGWIIKREQV